MKNLSSDELITRYLDDSASDEEMAQLNHLLVTSPKIRRQFNEVTEHAMAIVQAVPVVKTPKTIRFPKWLTVAALVCGLLALTFMLRSKPMAEVISSGGEVEVPSGEIIASGDTLKTIGNASFLNFEFSDGTKVHLGGDTIATVTGEDQKRLLVHQGSASLNVTPQDKSAPLILMTPTAEITVLGTFFGVFSTEGATRLEVTEGAVDLKRLSDGQSVQVKAGQYSVASEARDELGVKTIPTLGSIWSVDFRDPPEKVVGIGVQEFDANGTPIGARGKANHYGAAEVLSTKNAWRSGDYALFRAEQDTVLKVRLKMDNPQWLNFIVNFRSSKPGSTDTVTCLYQDPAVAKLAAGQWHTVELPLAKPKLHGDYFGEPNGLPVGWSCFSVSVSAGDERRGLVVEKMWTE